MRSTPTASPTPSPKSFRDDINGLRAWAVIAVLLYHFGVPGFAGGFIGVDVFFVISGFLMTQIIISGMDKKSFSIWSFYVARANRIIPALLALCIALLVLGWFWLPTVDYRKLGTHAATAIAFVSNIKFWSESGYFESESHDKWLLHTWSLSVEWQFYILLPLVIAIIWRLFGKQGVKWALLGVAGASFAYSIYLTHHAQGAAFYLLSTRAWEMLAGGMVWWLTRQRTIHARQARAMEITGLAMIVLSIELFDAETAWPGGYAALPVIGAMLTLAAGRQNSPFTTNVIAKRLGTSSYSIYLWHWPVVVLFTYAGIQHETYWIAAGLLISIALGELSYHWIENPARKLSSILDPRKNIATLGAAVVATGCIAVGVRYQNVENRIQDNIETAANESLNVKPRRDECLTKSGIESISCIYGGDNIRAIVIGDSHADAITTSVQAALHNSNEGIVDWSYVSCPTISGIHIIPQDANSGEDCHGFNEWATSKLKNYTNSIPLIIVNRTSAYAFGDHNSTGHENKLLAYFSKTHETPTKEYLDEFKERLIDTACSIAKERPVYLVRPFPEMMVNVPKTISRSLIFGKTEEVSISIDDYHKRHAFVWSVQDEAARRCNVKILDPLPYLCSEGRCRGSKNGRPLYYDDDHLSEYGNKLLTPMFRQVFTSDALPSGEMARRPTAPNNGS
ncbi:acyltransferase [Pseudomonas sp. BN417]|uniref:acyltransferase family protein n=1 Tax=Pseudomonas sp. BN417 TaxID=2567890 RepID=UPI0024558352|nr:acyltransferase family protein [Pseudomonas sp. BN417]MDH4554221.1 acyltransferase [Pseudomonas sp. BN417]